MSTVSTAPPPRHLTDVPFRFGPPSPEPPARPVPPAAAGTWSLDDVLGALGRGARVSRTRKGWRLAHAHRRPGLAAALNRHAAEVEAWTGLGLAGVAPDPSLRAWPDRVRLYVAWLDAALLPSGPELEVGPGVRLVDRKAFRAGLQARLDAGPGAPSARGLAAGLSALFDRYAGQLSVAAPPSRIARAA